MYGISYDKRSDISCTIFVFVYVYVYAYAYVYVCAYLGVILLDLTCRII